MQETEKEKKESEKNYFRPFSLSLYLPTVHVQGGAKRFAIYSFALLQWKLQIFLAHSVGYVYIYHRKIMRTFFLSIEFDKLSVRLKKTDFFIIANLKRTFLHFYVHIRGTLYVAKIESPSENFIFAFHQRA